jgi:hypothetical protein
VTSGFRRHVDENCPLLGFYAASSGNPLPSFRDNVSAPSSGDFLTLEDGTDKLFRKVAEGLPLGAASCPGAAQISDLIIYFLSIWLNDLKLCKPRISVSLYNLFILRPILLHLGLCCPGRLHNSTPTRPLSPPPSFVPDHTSTCKERSLHLLAQCIYVLLVKVKLNSVLYSTAETCLYRRNVFTVTHETSF